MIPSVVAGTLARSVEDFLRATFPVSTPAMAGLLDELFDPGGMFKGPYLSINLPHRLAEGGEDPFPEVPLGYPPYRHQQAAFERIGGPAPRSTIVAATGTGSGKTECFLLPILEYCRRKRALGENGIKAILIYPMNALATDQAKRIARRVHDTPSLRGKVTAGLYVGDSEREPHAVMSRDSVLTARDAIRDSPPDILLTNYKMLDYLLIRPRDRRLWRNNEPETLRFVVVDELHSFDGAQGTDLACLLRRLRARLGVPEKHLACMGTSATLGTAESRDDLCAYAQRIFGEDFDNDAVIGEQRQTVGEFLEDVFTSVLGVPGPAHELRPEAHTGLESYLRAQHRLWFGADIRLTSVMLGSLFATPFGEEDDRQVIAFSDSVQDAAHRAGFFGARTYRFNFRTALQRASEAAGEGVSLAELTDRTTRFWQQILGDDVRYVGTFLPSDLEWLHGWNELRETGKLGNQFDLLGIVDRRVAWEVMSEHGLRARLGRTLERAGASIVRPDPRRLDDAVLTPLPILQNEVGGLRRLSEERLRVFLLAVLLHLRQQGGILHPFLDEYVNQGGNTFVLGRPRHMPRFGPASRAPGFYSDAALPRTAFERVLSSSGNRAWSAGWASACFAELEPLVAEYLDRIMPPTLTALVCAGLLEERCIARGCHRVWGLRPDALLLSLNVERLRCARCHHEIAAASDEAGYWEGAPCLRVFCGGAYARARSDDQAYYRSLYGHGHVHRVVAREHTSLLDRDVRETMERRFIASGRGEGWPWDPNVLSATSTFGIGR